MSGLYLLRSEWRARAEAAEAKLEFAIGFLQGMADRCGRGQEWGEQIAADCRKAVKMLRGEA